MEAKRCSYCDMELSEVRASKETEYTFTEEDGGYYIQGRKNLTVYRCGECGSELDLTVIPIGAYTGRFKLAPE